MKLSSYNGPLVSASLLVGGFILGISWRGLQREDPANVPSETTIRVEDIERRVETMEKIGLSTADNYDKQDNNEGKKIVVHSSGKPRKANPDANQDTRMEKDEISAKEKSARTTEKSNHPQDKAASKEETKPETSAADTPGAKSADVTKRTGVMDIFRNEMLNLKQEDKTLVQHIQKNWINPPSDKPINLEHPQWHHFAQRHQSQTAKKMLLGRQQEAGFFVELGAGNGERFSNSLFFERDWGWNGLLIEANPELFAELMGKNRKAYTMNACVSPTQKSSKLDFRTYGLFGGLVDQMEDVHDNFAKHFFKGEKKVIEVPCFPLFSIFLALNISHVDYFSLDVEGPELEILKTIPFDRVTFDLIMVEYYVINCDECTQKKKKDLTDVMTASGQYSLNETSSLDLFFLRSDLNIQA